MRTEFIVLVNYGMIDFCWLICLQCVCTKWMHYSSIMLTAGFKYRLLGLPTLEINITSKSNTSYHYNYSMLLSTLTCTA